MESAGARRTRAIGGEDARLLRENGGRVCVSLPKPQLVADLACAMKRRRTERDMSGETLSVETISTLLGFGVGSAGAVALPLLIGGPPARRTYPSGGALYPIELVLHALRVDGLQRACYHYQVLSHRLSLVDNAAPPPNDTPASVHRMLRDNGVSGPAAVFSLWIDWTRPSLMKYGEKAERLTFLEAGHVAQNLLLLGAALGLSSVPLCGFDDAMLSTEAGLDYPAQAIVYAIAVGASTASAAKAE